MRPVLVVLGVALAALLWHSARAAQIDPGSGLPDVDPADLAGDGDDDPWGDDPYAVDAVIPADDDMTNLQAFLFAIRSAEHLAADVASGNDYRTFYGGRRFNDLSDHPVITGELQGVPLPPEWCKRLGYSDGRCVSTAAGAYQFTRPTWLSVRGADAFRGWPALPDFSPESQDEAARRLLAIDGVLPLVEAGQWHDAVQRASQRWASLPGSRAGQNVRSWEFVAQAITDGLNAQA